MQDLVPVNTQLVPDDEFDAWREAKAARIELVQATAVLEVAAHLAEVHQQHLYRRDEGGFTGWVERRLSMSQRTVYNLLDVHKQLGSQSLQQLQTLPRRVLYLIARDSTPEEVRTEVLERAEDGEHFTHAQVKALLEKAGAAETDRHQKRIVALTTKYDAEVAKLKQDLAAALTPQELDQTINEALAPLKNKIKRLQDELDKRKRQAATRNDEFGLRSQAITSGLRTLATGLTITPGQMIEAAKLVASATGQPLKQVLAEDVANARNVTTWLNRFLKET